jgi:Tfp pilus assembly protein PilN
MQDGKKFLTTAGGMALSLAVLFATVWVVSTAWKKGQANATGKKK